MNDKQANAPLLPPPGEPTGVSGFIRRWDRFWFTPADPINLGVMRIFAGLVMLYVHLIYSLDLFSMIGPNAWVDARLIHRYRTEYEFYPQWPTFDTRDIKPEMVQPFAKGLTIWSVWFHVQSPEWIVTLHVLFLLAMFCFTIGFCTRIAGVISWVGAISYIERTQFTLFGQDAMMIILLTYLTIGPSGAVLSLDRWLEKWWARRQGKEPPPVEPMVSANFVLRMFQIHFCFIYAASGLSKLQGPAWWSGWAIWGTMANYSFAPMHWPAYLGFLKFMCEYRWLWEFINFSGAMYTLVLEISFPYLVWLPRWRWMMVTGSVLLHLGIGVIMGLATFSLFMLCLVMCFIPADTLREFLAQVGARTREMFRGRERAPASAGEPALAER